MSNYFPRTGFVVLLLTFATAVRGQFLMDVADTNHQVHFSGYIQPQFQYIQSKGAGTYNGEDFSPNTNNRFTLRRGRIKIDYTHFTGDDRPLLQLVFQFDGTERGVFIRDFWGRVFDTKWNLFAVTTGMFARPFGFEINLSSSDRESPERGRMSQILMRTERDLGAMISFAPKAKDHPLRRLNLDAGIFNGSGLTSPRDFDSYKDFIGRISLKPVDSPGFSISGGLSYYNGGILQNSRYVYQVATRLNQKVFTTDSSTRNLGRKAPRRYYGADLQLRWRQGNNVTEFRAEYWQGKQTALAGDSETPGELPNEPYYIRDFNGAFFYLLQKFGRWHQIGLKYDWYDPNTKVKGKNIGVPGANMNETNLLFSTLGLGYTYHISNNCKLLLWYDVVRNEQALLDGFRDDLRDNIFTSRLQFRF